MKKHVQSPDDDIAQEHYKGPSVASAMAGEGFIAHFKWAFIALAVVGGTALAFPRSAGNVLEALRTKSRNLRVEKPAGDIKFDWSKISLKGIWDEIKTGLGSFFLGVLGHGKDAEATQAIVGLSKHHVHNSKYMAQEHEFGLGLWIANHTVGLLPYGKGLIHAGVEKWARLGPAFSAAGPFAFFGYFVLPIFLSGGGAEKGRAGKRQFERSKDEIWDLRAENDQLREKTIDLKTRLADVETTQEAEKLRVSRDDPPVIRETSSTPIVPLVHETDKDSPEEPTAPKIESPTVTDPLTGKVSQVSEAPGTRSASETKSHAAPDALTAKASHVSAIEAQRAEAAKEAALA